MDGLAKNLGKFDKNCLSILCILKTEVIIHNYCKY